MNAVLYFLLVLPLAYCALPILENPCKNNSHAIGRWQRTRIQKNGAKKSFHCCGWDDVDYLHNVSLCGDTSLGNDGPISMGESKKYTSGINFSRQLNF